MGRTPGLIAMRLALPMLLASAAACTTLPVDYQVAGVTPAPRRLPTGLPVVDAAFEVARQGAGPLPANAPRVTEAWSLAATDAIRRSGLFMPTGPSSLEIVITIQGLSGTDGGDSLSAAAARYVVRRGPNGPVLLDTTILTDGSSAIDYSATGDGQRDARNTAVKQNILRFLGALESIDPARIPGG